MLFLRVPTSDKHPRQGSPPPAPACWAKRGSHRLAFPPEREVKSPRCRRRLLRCAGSARQHPRVPLLRVPLPRAAQPRPRASPGPQPRWKWIFTSLEKRSSPPPGRAEAGAEARYPSRMRMSPSRGWLLAQVCSAFVSLDYQLGLGKRPRASR